MGLITRRPFLGWGFGTFESAFPTVQSADIESHYDHAHNDWLEWTTDGGITTLLAALTLAVLALRRGDTASRAVLVAVALHAVWDFSLRIPAAALATAATMGLGYAAFNATGASRSKASGGSWTRTGAP
jgi:O-antigen ligase